MTGTYTRRLDTLTPVEFDALLNAFADEVLTRFRVSGSVAGRYNLYTALEDEYAKALLMSLESEWPKPIGRR